MKKLIEAIKKARFVFICGNGGSATTAEHFTCDLFSKGIKAICLNSNISIMTMISNDLEYQFIFSDQLNVYANRKDLLITISCSGTSPNIVNAIRNAKIKGLQVYSFETFKKGDRNYGALEDKHLAFAHKLAEAL